MRVFICYKKRLLRQEEGVQVVQDNTKAEILHYILAQHEEYEPWMDDAALMAGMRWETEIYRQILASDVLLVLIGPGTSRSEWVRRELALATALGLAIVPLGFELSDEEMVAEVKALNLADRQYVMTRNIALARGDALILELAGALDHGARATAERQGRRRPRRTKARDDQRAAGFELPGGVALHLASGDIARVRGIDALVNPENDYMQMARFFESHTVSSLLRRRGATIKAGLYVDTIQQELDWQLRERGRPVQAGEAFATSAGGPGSDLAKVNRARAILHVAAVQAVDAESKVIPYKHPHQIQAAVRSVMAVLSDINAAEGVFSPPATPQRAEQERLAALGDGRLRSVILPLFGTGQGGAETSEVIRPIIEGLVDTTELVPDVREIYISCYAQEDLDIVAREVAVRLA
ncbi:O-acetyl-ADP-ribose deacetylase (regulator of RNase III) [Nonomuraea thailandensis]|uniref:O-acetyl-ADP-ribose deacetylase (Regulator of RNase III) n=1 Tax=Nonomuraea thailandensis TaxID=1188745 RepID=A0A9X2GJ19_9ACTN|nr:TIR domain-containing protein [Nonomuraea thailandensis]MCP2359342.1 O-acetyl-ADP-ribose deacetylase (regulator of RNase III) [Nonomuraea thailandensis]